MKKIISTVILLCLSIATAEARPKSEAQKQPKAAVEAPAKKSLLKRIFSFRRDKPAAKPVAQATAPVAKVAPKKAPAKTVVTSRSKAKPVTKAKAKSALAVAARGDSRAKETVRKAIIPAIVEALAATKKRAAGNFGLGSVADVTHSARVAPRWKPTYSKSQLGLAWERAWSVVLGKAERAPSAGIEAKSARVTAYSKTERAADAYTKQGKTSTGVTLRAATATQIGVAAGHPEDVGKYVTLRTDAGNRTYFIADSGSALVTKKADTANVGEVVDLYAPGGQTWSSYQDVTVVAVEGAGHLLLTPPSERGKFLEWGTYWQAVAMAQKS